MVEAVPRATCAGGNTNVVVAPAATVSRTAPDPIQVATPRCPTGLDGLVSLTPLSPAAPDLEPAQRPPPPQGSAQHIDGPAGPPNLSTPLLQGLARLVSDSASMLDLGTPPLQGSARSIVMPAGLGGTRTPSLQGLAQLFDLVLAALDVPSADRYLSLLLNAWSHNPGPCPNTSFAGNVFDPALQPARHGSMQECAFAWSILLSLYPDPIYRCQLLGMTKHGCLLGYDRPLHPVFRPQASNCWSGSPTSPALVALSTQPSTGSVPSNPTTWTLASTPQVSPAAASSVPCVVTSACTALATQTLSSPSPCRSSARSSSLWERWPTSSPKTTSSFRRPLPASSTQASWSGTAAPTAPPSSQSPPSSRHLTMLCSPSPPPRLTLSGRVCVLLPRKWAASSAWSLVSGTSPTVAHFWRCSLALALPASTLSPGLPSSPSSTAPSRLAASRRCSTLATLSVMVRPPGRRSTAPPPLTSSHLAGGAPTATATTLTDRLRSTVLWLHRPSSLSVMAPWFPAAPPGEIQAWPDPGLLAPNPIETTLSCAGTSMTGLEGREPPSLSPRLDPRNPFSVFSSWSCPCPI
ncbi:hypothetical protein NDA13_005256 [Ustilago tritici]|nr:hypothetical protein NDA13_005256 [Ustilago tritici]